MNESRFLNQNVNDEVWRNSYINVKNYILYNLGYPVIRVELTEEHLISAIIEAVSLWSKYSATVNYDVRKVYPGVENSVDIPDDILPRSIVDVMFARSAFDMLTAFNVNGDIFNIADTFLMPMISPVNNRLLQMDLTTYYLFLQKLEDFKLILGIDKFWEIIGNKIELYPKRLHHSVIGIIYKPVLTEAEAEQEDWIKQYSLARCKIILGTIRSKLSGHNSAGINISSDGEALKSEGKEELTALREDLKLLGTPMPIFQTNIGS